MVKDLVRKLGEAGANGMLIRIKRKLEAEVVDGYVVAVGRSWFLLAVVGDVIKPEGYQAYRIADVTKFYDQSPTAAFKEAALDKRGIRRPAPIDVSVSSAATILSGVMHLFPLVTIRLEIADSGVCFIGQIHSMTKHQVSLLEITPNAVWKKAPTTYRLSEITRIDFGGPYEEALAMVGFSNARTVIRSADQW